MEAKQSGSLIVVDLMIPECPISPNNWLGKPWKAHAEMCLYKNLISLAILKPCFLEPTGDNLMKTIKLISSKNFKTLWSTLASHTQISKSRRKSLKGWTRIRLTFKPKQK